MKVIDLTLPLNDGIIGFSSEPARILSRDGWNATYLKIYSHSGTHMDAQFHFEAGSETIDKINPERLIGQAWICDLPDISEREIITVDHLNSLKDNAKAGDFILFRTGWSKYVADNEIYRNRLPRIGEDLAKWLAETEIGLIGVEPPSVADVNNSEEITLIHRILLEANIIIVEGLTNLHLINGEKVDFIALPLKIENGDGSPCRAIAIED
jgi:arylformamidase